MSVTQPTHDWDFRQASSTTITDSIGGLTATYNGGMSSTVSDGATFDGTDDYISFAPTIAASAGFSIECYFNQASVGTITNLIDIAYDNTINQSTTETIQINTVVQGTSQFRFLIQEKGTNTSVQSNMTQFSTSTWIHCVFTTNNSGTATLYVNGTQTAQETSISASIVSGTRPSSVIGATAKLANTGAITFTDESKFNGKVGYFRIWNNTELSTTEITTLYRNRSTINYFSRTYESGIVPLFDYDFRVGNKDLITGTAEAKYYQYSSGTSTEITKENTINGVSIVGDTPTAAVSGSSSGRDNAGGQYIDLTGDLDTSYQEITIEVYVNIDSTTGKEVDNAGIFHFGVDDRDEMFKLYTNYGSKDYINMIAQYNENSSTSITQFTTSSLIQNLCDGNTYMHLVYTCNGPTMTVYLNGASFLTATNNSFSFGSATRSLCELGRSSMYSSLGGFIFATYKYCRIYNTALSSTQAATLYNNRDSVNHLSFASLRSIFGDVYLAQTLNKTLVDYKAENIPIQDISFGAFPANKYKQSYIKDLLDVSGSFIQRQHIFYSDMSFNVSDLSANQVIVNNDLSINSGFNIFQDSSFNSHVGIVGDASINGTLTIEDNSIPESALNFAKPATNVGTFDSTQDVSMSSTFTLQGDHERFIDLSQNIQTDFSENIVLVPGSLGIDLSGGTATLSGKTGDQAFLNGTYIVKDNSGNTTGNIYDDINENTTSTPAVLSATPDYYWDFRVATPSGNTLADRVSGINATYYGGITSSETTGVSFTERSGWSSFSGNTQTQYIKPGNIVPGTNFTVEYYLAPNYTFNGFGQIFRIVSTSNGTLLALMSVYYAAGMNINIGFYPDDGVSYNVMAHSGTGNVYAIPYNTPSQVVVSYDDSNKVFKIYINGSLWSITYDDSSRATGATAENTSWGYASGTAVSNAEGSITCDNNLLGASGLTSGSGRPFEGNFYYVRHYKDKILTDADVAILYANASTINWDFQTVVNNNKLTSLPKNWNTFQLQSGGGWLYDGSSNYTSYLDQYGRPQTVKGDNYDLTLPFHFYPSKAFLRTTPVLPTGTTNPDNYPASVKFLGASTQGSNYDNVTLPTYNWDFRVDTSTSINDSIQNVTATYYQTSSTVEDGLTFTGSAAHATIPTGIFIGDSTNEISFEIYFKITALGNWSRIFQLDATSANANIYLSAYGSAGYMNFGYGDKVPSGTSAFNQQITNLSSSSTDEFIHLIGTIESPSDVATNGTIGRYYKNGTLIQTITGGRYTDNDSASASTDVEYIGAHTGPSYSATDGSGYIRYLRFYNKRLSEEEVTILYSNRNMLSSFANIGNKYHLLGEFDNKATTVFADSSANYPYNSVVYFPNLPTAVYAWDFRVATSTSVNDLVNNATATYYQTSSTVEDGLAFTGQNAHATIPAGILINSGPSEVSWEIYFKYTTALGTWDMILHLSLNSNNDLRFAQYGNNGYFTFRYGNVSPSNIGSDSDSNREHKITNLSTSSLVDTWIHLIATVEYPADYTTNGTTIRYYHNGSLINTVTGGGYNTGTSATTSSDTNSIGANYGSVNTNYNSNGNIRYLRFFNKKLSEEEITILYNSRDNRDAFNGLSNSYIHGADFLYNLNRKYYVNQLRMIVDKAPHILPTSNAPTHFWNFRVDQTINSGSSIQDSISGVNGTFNTTKTLTSSLGYTNTNSSTEVVTIDSMTVQGTFSVEYYGQFPGVNSVGTCAWFFLRRSDNNDTNRLVQLKSTNAGLLTLEGSNLTASQTASSAFSTGVNIHLVGVFNNDDLTAKLYQNGSLLLETTMTAARETDEFDQLTLFNVANPIRGMYVNAYQVRMWNGTALPATEVSTIYKTLTGSYNYGEYSIDRLAYSGSSFSGKKMESNNPNLYLNTAYDISYGFTEDHTTSVYDLSYNKNQFSILDVSGGGVVQVNPIIKLEDSSLNTEKITSGATIGVHYENKFQTPVSSFNNNFYTHLGIRDSTTLFNNRISNDGKTIATLNHRGTQGYDLSNAEVVFSTDYGKNWKNVLQDCSDTFLFNENDISYGFLFTTGDASGTIDIATSGNGQTMYVGRQRNVFSTESNYTGGLGYVAPQTVSLPSVAATNNHTDQSVADLRYFPQCFIGNNTGSSDITVSNLTGTEAAFNGTFKVSMSSGLSITNSGHRNLWGLLGTDSWTGQYGVNGYTIQVQTFTSNKPTVSYVGGSVTLHYLLLEFPAYVKFDTWYFWVDDRFRTGSFIGTDANGDNQLLGSWSDSWNNGQQIYARSFNGANNTYVNKLYIMLDSQGIGWGFINPMWFTGTYQTPSTPGIPIPTSGLPEIYTTNYGNSWKISPFKYHSGPTIISGDGSTILLLQQHKLNNDRHGYVSSLGNETSSIDCHWLTTDYGATWRTLNRSGHDASNNIIPPSYGSKTATFFKACMSYSGQYIYIYNVQCSTNSNYGELYYSHDYGVTFNKWVTSEAQTVITGTGQISCSGSGKYVYIAGTNSSSAFVYYRSTDYGLTFNKDITKFPWQSYTLSESSTSAGPFISYEGDLIVTAGSNTSVTTGNSDLQYSLDYGVNYNDLSLNSDTISNITNSFINLPNKTNTLFTTTDVSTKTGIFANSPGPNEYKFLTNVLGQTDISNIYLQTIEFPKENPTKTIENEGPVFFTSEEPIDKENDFGQNISNSLIGSNKLWNIAVSEDGQKLLAGGAVDISNGEYYSGYNLTNAKFPPTENQVSLSNIIAKPVLDFDFRVASTTGITDSISGVAISYLGSDTSTVSGGYYKSAYDNSNRPYTTSSTFSGIGTNFSVEFYFMHGNTSSSHNTRSAFSMQNTTTGEYFSLGQDGEFKNRVVTYINGTTGARWYNTTSGRDTKIHLTFVYDYDNQVAKYYENSSYLDTYTTQYIATTHVSHLDDGNLKAFSSGTSTVFDSILWCGSTGGRIVGDANYYYTRIYNKALTQTEIDYLYANRDTVSASLASNWTVSPYNNLPQFRTANLSYNGNHALLVPYGVTQIHQQKLIYWTASGDFHRFEGNHMSNFDEENWKFGKLSGDGNFFVGFTHSSTALSDTNYNSDTWWTDPVSNTMIIYKTMQKISKGTVADATATTEAGGTTYDLNNAFSSDSGVTSYHITHVNVSETGQYILIVGGNSSSTYTNRCAFSSDFGVTFSDISSKFSFTDVTKALVYCHVSDNGRYLFISQYNSNEYCFSSDYGNTFTLRNTFPSSTKTYGVVSRDGQNALFVDTNKYVYTSVNGNFRQEVIPALSGVNSGLSLTHNNWKYTSTLSDVLTYNPSMPNIKYFLGTISTEVTTPTFYWDFRQTVSAGGTVTDNISGNVATLTSSNASCSTSGGLTIVSDNSTAAGWADYQPFTPSTDGFSLEIYFKIGDVSWWPVLFVAGTHITGGAGTFINTSFQHGGGSTFNHRHSVNGTNMPTTSTLNENTVYHMVITLDAVNTVYTVYVDGSQVYTTTDGTGWTSGFPDVSSLSTTTYNRIGARGDGLRGINGNVYYARVWNGTAITSSEVSTLYANRNTISYNVTNKITSSTVRYTGSYFSELDIKGSLTNLSGTGYTSSDYRVKKNVTSLDETDTIASLVPVSYTQNNLHHKKAIGFIAHEFAQSFPDLVIGEKDGPEMQSINYNGIIAVLIKEVQTLRAKINELKSQI